MTLSCPSGPLFRWSWARSSLGWGSFFPWYPRGSLHLAWSCSSLAPVVIFQLQWLPTLLCLPVWHQRLAEGQLLPLSSPTWRTPRQPEPRAPFDLCKPATRLCFTGAAPGPGVLTDRNEHTPVSKWHMKAEWKLLLSKEVLSINVWVGLLSLSQGFLSLSKS